MARLRSDFWVSAHLRRCAVEGTDAVLRRRGAAEAGAIFVKVDRLDGTASLFGPAPPSLSEDRPDERAFTPVLTNRPVLEVDDRIRREVSYDPDLWLIEIDDGAGRHWLDLSSDGSPA